MNSNTSAWRVAIVAGSYIKTVDLTKSGLGDPIVDEMAAVPLDLWAQKQGFTKLQPNLLQL